MVRSKASWLVVTWTPSVDRQTDKQTDTTENITHNFTGGQEICKLLSNSFLFWMALVLLWIACFEHLMTSTLNHNTFRVLQEARLGLWWLILMRWMIPPQPTPFITHCVGRTMVSFEFSTSFNSSTFKSLVLISISYASQFYKYLCRMTQETVISDSGSYEQILWANRLMNSTI